MSGERAYPPDAGVAKDLRRLVDEYEADLAPVRGDSFEEARRRGRTLSLEEAVGVLVTLAREESITEVRVAGELVWPAS